MSKQTEAGEIIAIFEVGGSRRRVYLKSTILGGLYRQWEDGQAGDYNAHIAGWDVWSIKEGIMEPIKTPYPMYHVWHVCMCDECSKVGGRTFDHSQGAWDEHLRYVPSDKLFTFPTAKEEMKA